jgi:hypothetical protein
LALSYQDYVQSNGDRTIDLHGDGHESGLAMQLATRKLGIETGQALLLLRGMDRFDGIADGRIKLSDLEYFSAVDDLNQLLPTQIRSHDATMGKRQPEQPSRAQNDVRR